MDLDTALILIPLLPLLGFLYNAHGSLHNWQPGRDAGVVATLAVVASFALSVFVFTAVGHDHGVGITLFEWIAVGEFRIDFALEVVPLSGVMLLFVTGVGALIHLYSISYMAHDPGVRRFFAYMNLFMFSMLLLVMGGNLVVLFIGWEGVGLCSYLLIGFWYRKRDFGAAGMKAFIVNRIGDLGFILGIFALYALYLALPEAARPAEHAAGPVAFSTLNHMFEWIQDQPDMILQSGTFAGWSVQGVLLFAGLFLFVGATGKSAQIPLFTWLPDAMAGPTPVSALIHAATMVTAGVYMCARMSHLYALIPAAGAVIALVGAATALLAASIALTQRDIKKVLAYSTVSQLGYMFIGIGVGAYAAAIFHVVTHAFFKALLFLGAGAVIHALGGHQGSKQDMHKDMGGLRKHLPVAHITMLLATLAIAGWPFFMSGAVSKDDILFNAGAGMIGADNGFQWAYGVAFVLGLIGAAFTAFYMFRLMALTFWGDYRGDPASVAHARAHGRDGWINVPLIVLAILSVIGGAINLPANWTGTTGLLYDFLHHTVAHSPVEGLHENYGWLEWTLQGSLFIGLALVIAASIHLYTRKPDTLRRWSEAGMGARLHAATSGAWGIDAFYRRYIVTPIVYLAEILYFIVDVVIIDGIIIGGLSLIAELVAGGARKIQSGQVNAYVLAIAGGGLVVLAYLLWTMLP